MRILFVVPYTPNLIRVRPYNFIRALAERGNHVTVLTLTANQEEEEQAHALAQICEVITHPLPRWRSLSNSMLALPGRDPLQSVYCWQPALAANLQRLVRQNHYDAVHVEHIRGARYGVHLRQNIPSQERPPVVWDSVDCITALFRQATVHSKSFFGRFITRFELGRTARYEGWLQQQFDHVLVTSPADRQALAETASGAGETAPITVIPNGVDLAYFRPDATLPRADNSVVFSGKMSYHANITMALFLAQEIMPLVWAQRPDVRLTIVGKNPSREILALAADDRITVTGTVPSIRPYLQQAAIAVAPLRYGAGIQNKILEAMACGAPVITTAQATRALTAKAGQDLLVADDAMDFAAAILDLLTHPQRRAAIAAAGLAYVHASHDWDTIAARLEDVYLAAKTRRYA